MAGKTGRLFLDDAWADDGQGRLAVAYDDGTYSDGLHCGEAVELWTWDDGYASGAYKRYFIERGTRSGTGQLDGWYVVGWPYGGAFEWWDVPARLPK